MVGGAEESGAQDLVIIGAGGHAREILDLALAQNRVETTWNVRGCLVDAAFAAEADRWPGPPRLGDLTWLNETNLRTCALIVAIGDPAVRARIVGELESHGAHRANYATLVHPSAVIGSRVELAQGVVVGARSVLTCDITVGRHAHINVASSLAHDCRVDEFATLAPGVNLAGWVHLGAGVDIGMGATVIPKVQIGEGAVVGAGSTVLRDVAPNTTVVGTPARPIARPS
jgi:sugar O-acyltransferase (sialic acid O-acetyltransferase NeuD family)